MEESPLVQTEPLHHSGAAVSFPAYCRRPLLSRTHHTLVEILLHCRTSSPLLQTQDDIGHIESRSVCAENISTTDVEVTSIDLLVPLANSDDSVNKLIQETSIDEGKENVRPQEGTSSCNHAAGPKFSGVNLAPEGNQEIALACTSNVEDLSMVDDCAIQIVKEQNNASSGVDIPLDDLGASEKLEMDMDFSVNDFSDILDSCFGMDIDIQSLDAIQGSQENGTVLEDTHKQSEYELHMKEMELEKLIYSSGVVEPTSCPNTNDDMEEGEISGDFGVIDASSEDVVSLYQKSREIKHASQVALDKEKLICSGEDTDPALIEKVNGNNDCMKVKSRTTAGRMPDCSLKNLVYDVNAEAQNSGFIGPCLETPVDNITHQNSAKNPISDSVGKDEDANKKKRKKGPLTKEGRAKKKKKNRIKRAENNRKLGIKRLKLPPPVLKEKKIVYCRHYLQGRCHEGDKCKFSHDTVPLTKSKPCGHFARNSCLKGDACPFDHELSKYPCTNYTTNGFCSRGSDCLFSHEMPAKQSFSISTNVPKPDCASAQHTVLRKEGSLTASKVAKADVPSPLNNSNFSKPINDHRLISHKIDAKSCSAGNSPHLNAEPAAKTSGKTPKGISFLLNGGMSFGEGSGSKQDGSSLKSSDNGNICDTVKILGSAKKLNEMSDSATPKKPRGINFLSFAQLHSDDSSNKMFSNLLSNRNLEAGNSVTEGAGEGKLSGLYLESVGMTNDSRLMNQSAAHLVWGVIEKDKGAPAFTPQNRNLSPFDKVPSLVPKRQGNLLSEGSTALSLAKEIQGTSSQLHNSTEIPSLSFSSGPGGQPTGQQKADVSSSFRSSYLPNAPSSVQKAVQSTLAFAAKFEPAIKIGLFAHQGGS